jgi:hypothetical protein
MFHDFDRGGGILDVFRSFFLHRLRFFASTRKKTHKKGHPLKTVEQMEQTEHSFVIKDLRCTSLFLL